MRMLQTVYRPGHPLNLRQTLSPLVRGLPEYDFALVALVWSLRRATAGK